MNSKAEPGLMLESTPVLRRVSLLDSKGNRLLEEFETATAARGHPYWRVKREIALARDGSVTWKFPTPDNDQWSRLEPQWTTDDPENFGPQVAESEFDRLWAAPIAASPRGPRKGRWRTWLRTHTPTALYRLGLVIPKIRDCGDHDWYYSGDGPDGCYHCEVTRLTPRDAAWYQAPSDPTRDIAER